MRRPYLNEDNVAPLLDQEGQYTVADSLKAHICFRKEVVFQDLHKDARFKILKWDKFARKVCIGMILEHGPMKGSCNIYTHVLAQVAKQPPRFYCAGTQLKNADPRLDTVWFDLESNDDVDVDTIYGTELGETMECFDRELLLAAKQVGSSMTLACIHWLAKWKSNFNDNVAALTEKLGSHDAVICKAWG